MLTGIITLWNGAVAAIPSGWKLCDGNNGTPDLRNRFVVGAGDTYAVGASGGSINHLHAFTSNNHNHDFTGFGHDHDLLSGSGIAAGTDYSEKTNTGNATGTTDNNTASGNTNNQDGRPPYYALAYIMKT